MRATSRLVFAVLILAVAVAPAIADSHEGGNIARVSYWKVDPDNADKLEEGIKAHNQLHMEHGDPHPIFTGIIISGDHQGTYVRGSLGHKWADFDEEGAIPGDVDQADMAKNIWPYVESQKTVFYEHQPELSHSPAEPMPIAQATFFEVKSGHWWAFREAIKKIKAALGDDWPPYDWYEIVDGGRTPTFVVLSPRANWAARDEKQDPDFETRMQNAMGEDFGEFMTTTFQRVEREYRHTMVFPAELSYTPAPESGDDE